MRPAGQMRPAKLFCPAHGEVIKKQFSYFSCKKNPNFQIMFVKMSTHVFLKRSADKKKIISHPCSQSYQNGENLQGFTITFFSTTFPLYCRVFALTRMGATKLPFSKHLLSTAESFALTRMGAAKLPFSEQVLPSAESIAFDQNGLDLDTHGTY